MHLDKMDDQLPKRSTPSFMRFLNTNRDLVDSFSICRVLTTDLYGAKYFAPETAASIDTDSSEEEGTRVDTKRRRKTSTGSALPPSSSASSISPKKTLKELYEGDSDLDEAELRGGFVDDEGENFYIIEKVIRYHPEKGYFVHWKGYPKSDRTWQLPEDMPSGFIKEMKKAREQYEKEKLFA